jgi:DNA replication and repair protein RecF
MTPSRIHRLSLTHFRNYRTRDASRTRGDVVVLVGPNGAGKTNCIEAVSFLSPGRGLRRATLDDVADNPGRRLLGGLRRGRGRARPRHARHRHRPAPTGEGAASSTALPHRPRAGRVRHRLRRSFAHRLADALRWTACFIGAASERRRFFDRLGAGDRLRAFQPGLRARPLACARATGSSRCAITTTIGATRSSARPPSSPSRSPRSRGQTVTPSWHGDAARARRRPRPSPPPEIMLDGWMENALATRARNGGGGSLPRDPARRPRRATPPPAAPSTARTSPTCRWSTRRRTCPRATPPPASRRRS